MLSRYLLSFPVDREKGFMMAGRYAGWPEIRAGIRSLKTHPSIPLSLVNLRPTCNKPGNLEAGKIALVFAPLLWPDPAGYSSSPFVSIVPTP